MTTFNLDVNKAKEADNFSNRITETGAYTGQLTMVKEISSDKGTKGVQLSFVSNDMREANFLDIWVTNNKNENIFGYNKLMALMTCLRVKSAPATAQMISEYNYQTRQPESFQANVYNDLMKKPIGLVLQKETYTSNSGENKEKITFHSCFDPSTKQMAVEVLEKKQPEKLDNLMANIKDKDSRKNIPSIPTDSNAGMNTVSNPQSVVMDDEIPF